MLFIICLIVILTILVLKFEIIVASGESMLPTIQDGDFLLVYKSKAIKHNAIYVIDLYIPNTYHDLVVKRVVHSKTIFTGEEVMWILGDNESKSYDSRAFGYVESNFIVGRVIKIWKTKKK